MSRTGDRARLDVATRVFFAESDLDRFERALHAQAREMDQRMSELRDEVAGMKRMLLGFMASLATASLLLVVNLIAGGVLR